jgi:hypothetical protein
MGILSFLRSLRETTPAAVTARAEAVHRRVAALSADDAESEVRDRVMMGEPFHATSGLATDTWPGKEELPAAVRSLFSTYQDIAAGGMQLRRIDVQPYARDTSYLRIGSDIEHADVVVRKDDGRLFVIEDDGAPEPDLSDEHSTVWHYLLEVAEHTRGGRSRPAV